MIVKNYLDGINPKQMSLKEFKEACKAFDYCSEFIPEEVVYNFVSSGKFLPHFNSLSLEIYDYLKKKFPLKCPAEGAFKGYKYVHVAAEKRCNVGEKAPCTVDAIATLLIPETAVRSSAFTNKCRASEARVLEIRNIVTNREYIQGYSPAHCGYDGKTFWYVSGETVKSGRTMEGIFLPMKEYFDTNRFHECSAGIHFFMSKEEAVEYGREFLRMRYGKGKEFRA